MDREQGRGLDGTEGRGIKERKGRWRIQLLEKAIQWRRARIVSEGHRFGFVKRPKIINVYRTTPSITILRSMRYCIRPVCHSHTIIKQETQLMLTNPRDAFRGQSRSPNIVPFHKLGIFLLCNSNCLYLFQIFDFKNVVTFKSGSEVTQDHWKWFHSIDCVWFPISVL